MTRLLPTVTGANRRSVFTKVVEGWMIVASLKNAPPLTEKRTSMLPGPVAEERVANLNSLTDTGVPPVTVKPSRTLAFGLVLSQPAELKPLVEPETSTRPPFRVIGVPAR